MISADWSMRFVIVVAGYVGLIGFAYFGGMSIFFWWLCRKDDTLR